MSRVLDNEQEFSVRVTAVSIVLLAILTIIGIWMF